ncbi:MAG: hypothetical protein ACOX7P_01735 [Oscillospiraceae bacterium]|jgi:hypothetical protein
MKRLLLLAISAALIISMAACTKYDSAQEPIETPKSSFTVSGAEEGVSDFLGLLGEYETGYEDDACFNITPEGLSESGFKLFKFEKSCASFLEYGGNVYKLGENFGGYGLVDMAAADLNGDGTLELYFSFSWGSGIHRAQLGYFDPNANEVAVFDYALFDSDIALSAGTDATVDVYAAQLSIVDFVNYTVSGADRLGEISLRDGVIALSDELAGEGAPQKEEEIIAAKIMGIYDGYLLLAGSEKAELYTVSSKLDVLKADGSEGSSAELRAGQTVEVGYTGGIMESYPSQFSSPVYIRILEQGDDLAGFYLDVLEDLWNRDEGLNGGISVLAFDLSRLSNLTDGEKSALVYMMSSAHGLSGVTGTFDELCEQGYIDREKLYFETGLLFEFDLSDVTGDSFTFTVTKWRSGLGAYMFHDCRAVRSGEGWDYTIGAELIS